MYIQVIYGLIFPIRAGESTHVAEPRTSSPWASTWTSSCVLPVERRDPPLAADAGNVPGLMVGGTTIENKIYPIGDRILLVIWWNIGILLVMEETIICDSMVMDIDNNAIGDFMGDASDHMMAVLK